MRRYIVGAVLALVLGLAVPVAANATAPVLTAEGGTLHWTKVPSTGTEWYLQETPCIVSGCGEFAQTFTGLEATPMWCLEGCAEWPLVHYRVREEKPKVGEYSNEVSIQYPIAPVSPMIVGVDVGGWTWESAINDEAGAVKYIRSPYTNFNTDAQMALLAKVGVTLLPLFGEEGTIASFDTESFVNTIVTWFKRYGKGGTYWAGKTDLGATTAELINEPGNPSFHSDCCTTEGHAKYADLTKKVKAAFTANFAEGKRPKTLVSYDGGFSGSSYGEAIFAAGAVADAVDVHPYGGKTSRELSAGGHRDKVEQAHAKTGLPVYVTEVGWPTIDSATKCTEEGTGDSYGWTETQQSENLTNFIKWARELKYVAAVVNFNYADYTGNCYGIVKAAGSPHKLSYEALHKASLE